MKKRLGFALALLSVLSTVVYGGAFQLYSESSTEAMSVAGAVVGRRGMISNAWYNPAATGSIDKISVMGGVSALKLSIDYSSDGGDDSLQNRIRPTGFFYAIVPMTPDLNFNLSINAPYGMITEWENDWTESAMCTYTNLRAIYTTPSLTWQINEELSVAAGVNLVYATARLARNIDLSLLGMNKIYMGADAYGIGGTLSAHYQLNPEWGFGAHYQSRVKLDFEGETKYRREGTFIPGKAVFVEDDASTTITLPSSLGLGVANNTFKDLTLSFDAVWTEWSTYADNNIKFDKQPGTGTPGTIPKKKDWSDVWSFRLGAEYALTENWVLRCGYMYDISPDNDRYRTPEMPDSDRNLFTVGAGYSNAKWGVDVGYGYLFFQDSKAGSAAGSANHRSSGEFEADLHVLSVAFKMFL